MLLFSCSAAICVYNLCVSQKTIFLVDVQGHCCFCSGEQILEPLGLRGCPDVSTAQSAFLYVPQTGGEVLGTCRLSVGFSAVSGWICIIHSYHRFGLELLLSMTLLWYFKYSLCFLSHIHSNKCRKKCFKVQFYT